jgi:hypothetical protein
MMENLVRYFQETYFLDPIFFCTCILCFMLSIKLNYKHKTLRIFQVYFGAFVIDKISNYYFGFASNSITDRRFDNLVDYFFTILEFSCFAYFIRSNIHTASKRTIIFWISIFFYTIALFLMSYCLRNNGYVNQKSNNILYAIQATCLLILCIIYFVQSFKAAPRNLKQDPSFWIVVGLTFFTLSTLPFTILLNFLLDNYRATYNSLFSIFFVFYIFLFATVIRGYLCEPKPITYQ